MKKLNIVLIALITLAFSSCLKQSYDNPPNQNDVDPHLKVNVSIGQLSAAAFSFPTLNIELGDSILEGVVIADDRSGNFYKQIVIQDSTGGITVAIARTYLYNDYPVGRKIYIKTKGLQLVNYKGVPELVYGFDNTGAIIGIPSALITNYIVKATYPNVVKPLDVTLAAVSATPNKYINTLVRLDSVEFNAASYGVPYAQPATLATATSLTVEDCFGNSVAMYNSGYADFQPILTPSGKGNITGVYSWYGTKSQFFIRDTSDVQLTNAVRCDGTSPVSAQFISVDSLRKMYSGTDVTLPSVKISGVVISDKSNGNFGSKNMILQDGERGMTFFFSSAHSLSENDSVTIDLTGATLTSYNGVMEISGISPGKAIVAAAGGGHPEVRVATIAQVTGSSYATYESTLVQIMGATLSGSTTTYSGNKTLTDATGSTTLYTAASSTFASATVYAASKNYTTIVGKYSSSFQLQIRNLGDIQ